MASHDVASIICQALARGVTRSKQRAMRWMRKAADIGNPDACFHLANDIYADLPYAREIGLVPALAGLATPAGVMEVHDVSSDVLTSVVHWLRQSCATGQRGLSLNEELDVLRRKALEGAKYCYTDGCQFMGQLQLKDFKYCPQCKTARYCSAACQKEDWTTGGHKEKCGTFSSKLKI